MSTEEATPTDTHVRASGVTPAVEEAHDSASGMMDEIEAGNDIDRVHREPRFDRMRLEWKNPAQQRAIADAHRRVSAAMVREFEDAYRILDEINHTVRIPILNDEGDTIYDVNGEPEWERTPGGRVIEDYTRLTRKQQESFIGQITTHLFAWEQTAEMMWMDATMARGLYEEQFALSYDDLRGSAARTTVDDRRAYGNIEASQDRYLAIYHTSLSRRAQALCKSMERLSQRMKDVLLA